MGKSLLLGLTLTGVEELYITLDDVQMQRENFLQLVWLFGNTRGISVLKFSSDSKLHGCDRLSGYRRWPQGSILHKDAKGRRFPLSSVRLPLCFLD